MKMVKIIADEPSYQEVSVENVKQFKRNGWVEVVDKPEIKTVIADIKITSDENDVKLTDTITGNEIVKEIPKHKGGRGNKKIS